jgi:hypothetical protein
MPAIFLDVIIGDACLYEVKRRLQAIIGTLLCPLKNPIPHRNNSPFIHGNGYSYTLHFILRGAYAVMILRGMAILEICKSKQGEDGDLPLILTIDQKST